LASKIAMTENTKFKRGYSEVNGLKMYYEIYGQGKPIVLIHGGGSTIETSFGNIIPLLLKSRQVIAMELQAHGHTCDRNTDLTFEQDADDIAKLLDNLQIKKADFLGFSNGGHTAIEVALRYKTIVDKIILASTFYKRDAVVPQFWDGFDTTTLEMMPKVLQKGYLKANNDEKGLLNMFQKDVQKMKAFKGWTDEQMKSITAKTLIINGNNDVGSIEHAVQMYRILPNCELAILPGGHGTYLGTIESIPNGEWTMKYVVELIEGFIDKP
jgi:pimeloyl-ACP methyl ester carboxylesterase